MAIAIPEKTDTASGNRRRNRQADRRVGQGGGVDAGADGAVAASEEPGAENRRCEGCDDATDGARRHIECFFHGNLPGSLWI